MARRRARPQFRFGAHGHWIDLRVRDTLPEIDGPAMTSIRRIDILDTTLRDGELTRGVEFSPDDKVEIAFALARAGVDIIEIAAPASEPDGLSALEALTTRAQGLGLCVLLPCGSGMVEATAKALSRTGAPFRLHLYAAVFGPKGESAMDTARHDLTLAREFTDDVQFTPLNGIQATPERRSTVLRQAFSAGAKVFGLADTAGRALPDQVREAVTALSSEAGSYHGYGISFHAHDDLGMASANALAAARAGATQLELTVNGLGARAGNAALEHIAEIMREHGPRLNMESAIANGTRDLWRELSELVCRRSGVRIADNRAVVGPLLHPDRRATNDDRA